MRKGILLQTGEIRSIIRDYKQLYTHIFNNLDEMSTSAKTIKLPKSTQGKIDNLNNPITIKRN